MRIHVRKAGEEGKEYYTVLSLCEEYGELVTGAVDFAHRRISLESYKKIPFFESALKLSRHDDIKKIMQGVGKKSPHTLTIAVHPGLGITKYERIKTERANKERLISNEELQTMVEYAVAHSFEKSHSDTLRHLESAQLETFLADLRILQVRVDKNELYEKLRYAGKIIEMYISRTFTLQKIFKNLTEALPQHGGRVIWREGGAMVAHVVTRQKKKPKYALYVRVLEARTNVYVIEEDEVRFLDHFPWGRRNIDRVIASYMGIEEEIAREVIARCAQGNVSSQVKRKCDAYIKEEIETCLRGIESAAWTLDPKKKKRPQIYLDCMPYAMDAYLKKGIRSLYGAGLVEMYGFTFYNKMNVAIDTVAIAALLERFLSPKLPAIETAITKKIETLRSH